MANEDVVHTFDVVKYDEILSRGLSHGLGKRGGQMCIEAAICTVLGLPHGDDPKCVSPSVRQFKTALNDANWSSAQTRATGLRDLGLAQLGSLSIDGNVFNVKLSKKIITILIPDLFKTVLPHNRSCLAAAEHCKKEGSANAANAANAAATAANAANAANVAYAAAYAAYAAANTANAAAFAAYVANAAAYTANAAYAASDPDRYLILGAKLALQVLRELHSPGVALLPAK